MFEILPPSYSRVTFIVTCLPSANTINSSPSPYSLSDEQLYTLLHPVFFPQLQIVDEIQPRFHLLLKNNYQGTKRLSNRLSYGERERKKTPCIKQRENSIWGRNTKSLDEQHFKWSKNEQYITESSFVMHQCNAFNLLNFPSKSNIYLFPKKRVGRRHINV